MKKISLKNLNLNEVESLSREELKNVLGGFAAGTTTGESRCVTADCHFVQSGGGTVRGKCEENSEKKCVCKGDSASVIHEPCVKEVS